MASPPSLYSRPPIRGIRPSVLAPRTFHSRHIHRSALPGSYLRPPVLWPRLTPAASAQPLDWGCHLRRPGVRSPQVRTLTFPAALLHLPRQPLTASGFVVLCQLARLAWPRMKFVFLKSQVCLQLPPDPVSRRRPCLQLAVGAINLRSGLSPPSHRPCWAHHKESRHLAVAAFFHFTIGLRD